MKQGPSFKSQMRFSDHAQTVGSLFSVAERQIWSYTAGKSGLRDKAGQEESGLTGDGGGIVDGQTETTN
jgi:hypothetical protein